MIWTWCLFIIFGIAATIMAYKKKGVISRLGIEQASWMERFFGTDFGMICCACVTLAIILGFILKADPTIPQLREIEEAYERDQYLTLGERLASKVKAKADGGQALVITRAPSDRNLAQHESFMEGVKKGLGNVKVGAVVHAQIMPDDKSPDDVGRPFRLTNSYLNTTLQEHPNCSVVISTIGVCEDFVESDLAEHVTSGKRGFAIYSDNVYMQIYAGQQSRRLPFDYCVFPNPGYDHKQSISGQTFDFDKQYVEIDLRNRSQFEKVLKQHRRMFYYPKRRIVKEKSKKKAK